MKDHRSGGRSMRRILSSAVLLSTVLALAVPAPAHAGLLGTTLGIVDDTVDLLGATVDATTGLVVGENGLLSGWLYDESSTTMSHVNDVVGAPKMWRKGVTGAGVDVAVLDTGAVPIKGFVASPVANGPDLSFESQSPSQQYLDTFGHGTHMSGIIAGKDGANGGFKGVAPDARLVQLKLAGFDGTVDVSQVIAAIDWVVAHRRDAGMNIRVLNLSYGTDSQQPASVDPLAHAVENAWRHGIVVVVSGGNDVDQQHLNNPATNPYVIAVGAADTRQTVGATDDKVMDFSSRGDTQRRVDLVAPGRSILSLRNPGSYLDENYPSARVDDRYFKGSGTSQAAAVVSGAAALLLQERPNLSPDQVKALLKNTASSMPNADAAGRGAGMVNVAAASVASAPASVQNPAASAGTGSLEAARGTQHVSDNGVELTGEQSVLGAWDAATWAEASRAATAWNGGVWMGQRWAGDCWCGTSWAGRTWANAPWDGTSWGGVDWSGRGWSGRGWSGRGWSGDGWSGRGWSGRGWSGRGWSSIGTAE